MWVVSLANYSILIMDVGCVSSANYSILFNGRPRGKFRDGRDLRQGDPLSLFLFIIVADVMGRMIDKAKEIGLVEGLELGRSQTQHGQVQPIRHESTRWTGSKTG
ncbi:hypothetical protein Scep_004461 [Stephania cephalantha]|uniref:Reverse transcriptase n=1 Tax=Stephania cephalantha TaxID=152367 RepID=A0AAP0KSI0_9MAGN